MADLVRAQPRGASSLVSAMGVGIGSTSLTVPSPSTVTPTLDELAVAYWKAKGYPGNGPLHDPSGNDHDATLGSVGEAGLTGDYLSLPGVDDDNAETLDSAALSVAGDIDIRLDLAKDSYSGSDDSPLSKRQGSGTEEAYGVRIDNATPKLWWSADGSAVIQKDATAGMSGLSARDRVHVRVTLDVDNGAAGNDVKFYWRNVANAAANALSSDSNWTQLGSTVTTASTTSIFDGNLSVVIGSLRDGSGYGPFGGKIYRVMIYDGISGTVEFDADFTTQTAGATSFTEDSANAATVTINQSGAESNDPLFLAYSTDGEQYLYLPGTANDNATTTDQPQFAITDNMKVRVRLKVDDYNQTQSIVTITNTGDNKGYDFLFWSNSIRLSYNTDGTYPGWVHPVSAAHGVTAGTPHWFEAEFIDGDVTFREGATEAGLTLIDTVLNASTTVTPGTGGVGIAKVGNHGVDTVPMVIYEVKIYDDGVLVYHAHTADAAEPFATFTERSANAETVTINRAASGKKATVVDRDMFLLGTDDYLEIADHADLDFALADPMTVIFAGRTYDVSSASNPGLISKGIVFNGDGVAGWVLHREWSGDTPRLRLQDGTNTTTAVGPAMVAGEAFAVAGQRNRTDDEASVFKDGVEGTEVTDAMTGTLANAIAVRIGNYAPGGSLYFDGEFHGAAIFRTALSDAEILAAGLELLA